MTARRVYFDFGKAYHEDGYGVRVRLKTHDDLRDALHGMFRQFEAVDGRIRLRRAVPTPIDASRRRLVDKIEKVIRLASSPHEAEALAALRKAAKMIQVAIGMLTEADRLNLGDALKQARERYDRRYGSNGIRR